MNSAFPHLSSLDFDALALGHLDPARSAGFRAHLDECATCREQETTRRALADRFAREVLPRTLPKVRERLTPRQSRRLAFWGVVLAPVACAVVLAIPLLGRGPAHRGATENSATPVSDDLGIKGGRSGFSVYLRHGDKVVRVAPGGTVAAGDALRFVVETGPHRYLVIAGVDGGGHASVYHPFGQWPGAAVSPHTRFEVPGSLVLDDAPGPERIFALLATRPLAGERVRLLLEGLARQGPQAIRATVTLDLPEVETSSILLEKRETTP